MKDVLFAVFVRHVVLLSEEVVNVISAVLL